MLDTERYVGVIPESTLESLWMFAEHGVPTGGFLQAVLENDLMQAMGRADERNRAALFHICDFIHNEMPGPCHGSRAKWVEWIEQGGLKGQSAGTGGRPVTRHLFAAGVIPPKPSTLARYCSWGKHWFTDADFRLHMNGAETTHGCCEPCAEAAMREMDENDNRYD